MRSLVRMLMIALAVAFLATGGLGLGIAYGPGGVAETLYDTSVATLEVGLPMLPLELSDDVPRRAVETVAGFPLRFVLAPLGLVLLVSVLLPGGGRSKKSAEEEWDDAFAAHGEQEPANDKKALKRARKEAAAIARKGLPLEAAELCFSACLLDEAANYFIAGEEFVRAAEIRHDQNRFLESAELYSKAGHHDSAAVIYAQQDEHASAAESYVQANNIGLAAECFEKAGNHRRAAECFDLAEIPREAARAYARCEMWADAGRCLEAEILDMGNAGAGAGSQKGEVVAQDHDEVGRQVTIDPREAVGPQPHGLGDAFRIVSDWGHGHTGRHGKAVVLDLTDGVAELGRQVHAACDEHELECLAGRDPAEQGPVDSVVGARNRDDGNSPHVISRQASMVPAVSARTARRPLTVASSPGPMPPPGRSATRSPGLRVSPAARSSARNRLRRATARVLASESLMTLRPSPSADSTSRTARTSAVSSVGSNEAT